MTHRLHVRIEGRVQGVGFRYAACAKAEALGLAGWVRNLYDGGVEAEFEGPKADLDAMLAWCRHGPAFAAVTHLEAAWEDGPPRHEGFHVRH
ncbi:MAG TPA: acylphosphatase [Candidatus Hydrogenedentes bacterium]|nr:acylphosphatase [Candidatus Hydrogenedentota bacterium]